MTAPLTLDVGIPIDLIGPLLAEARRRQADIDQTVADIIRHYVQNVASDRPHLSLVPSVEPAATGSMVSLCATPTQEHKERSACAQKLSGEKLHP